MISCVPVLYMTPTDNWEGHWERNWLSIHGMGGPWLGESIIDSFYLGYNDAWFSWIGEEADELSRYRQH